MFNNCNYSNSEPKPTTTGSVALPFPFNLLPLRDDNLNPGHL